MLSVFSPGWRPTNFRGCVLWVRGGVWGLNAGNVASWTDLSGNAHNIPQAVPGKQPLAEAAGLNGRPSVLADGIDDSLHSLAFTLNQPYTVIGVAQALTLEANGTFWDGFGVNSMRFYDQGVNDWAMFAGATGPKTLTRDLNPHVFMAEYSGALSKLYVDGGTAYTGNPGVNNGGGVTLFVDGGEVAQFYNARFGEMIIYDGLLSVPQLETVAVNFGRYYSIPVLPVL